MRRLIAVLSLTLLAGCSQMQPAPAVVPALNYQAYTAQMLALSQWQLQGKVGIRTSQESNSAGFSWQQHADRYDISFFGPFNAQAARLRGDSQRITLEADGETYQADTPEALLEDRLGWQLPVRELAWWVRGLPAPNIPYTKSIAEERLSELNQRGWQIRYRRYSEDGLHPEKILLIREGLRITLVIHEWEKFLDN